MLGFLFGASAVQIAHRMDSMKAAESKLMAFSSRFVLYNNQQQQAAEELIMETFDTKIPRSVIPLADGSTCLLQKCGTTPSLAEKNEEEEEEETLVIHGVKVQTPQAAAAASDSASSPHIPLVLLHGYANGALYFYRNLRGLCSNLTYPTVYALDMLGWGLSSRPTFALQSTTTTTTEARDSIQLAEDFYVESLEAWRKAHQIPKLTLAGHSLGGYLSVAYCEKYPQHVHRLILLSPVGVPDVETNGKEEEMKERISRAPWSFRIMFWLGKTLWNRGVTPSGFLRTLPEGRGRGMVEGYVKNRLPAVQKEEEREALSEYLYTNAMLPGSGEYCLNQLMKPIAYAYKPTLYRIPHLQVSHVSFLYGDMDWMDISGGLEVQRACVGLQHKQQQQQGQQEQHVCNSASRPPEVTVHKISQAGHLLMLDHWQEFRTAVLVSGGFEHVLKKEENVRWPETFLQLSEEEYDEIDQKEKERENYGDGGDGSVGGKVGLES